MTTIFGSTEQRERLLIMNTKRCEKCNELLVVDGSHVCPDTRSICKGCGQYVVAGSIHVCSPNPCNEINYTKPTPCTIQEDDPVLLAIIAKQEVALERLRVDNRLLRVDNRLLRDALTNTIKLLDTARESIHNTLPYQGFGY